jgi:hypothetical protein
MRLAVRCVLGCGDTVPAHILHPAHCTPPQCRLMRPRTAVGLSYHKEPYCSLPRFLAGSRPAQSLLNCVKASPSPEDLARVITRWAFGRWQRRAHAGRRAYCPPLTGDIDGVEAVQQIAGHSSMLRVDESAHRRDHRCTPAGRPLPPGPLVEGVEGRG